MKFEFLTAIYFNVLFNRPASCSDLTASTPVPNLIKPFNESIHKCHGQRHKAIDDHRLYNQVAGDVVPFLIEIRKLTVQQAWKYRYILILQVGITHQQQNSGVQKLTAENQISNFCYFHCLRILSHMVDDINNALFDDAIHSIDTEFDDVSKKYDLILSL